MQPGNPPPGDALLRLVAVMDRLRSPGGCPWDREQTHASLATYLLEETYETLEAIDSGDDAHLREELGDLLLQVVFHARIAQERAHEPWTIDDVADGITQKLVRRHPHVFADAHAPTAADVEASWEALKAAEKRRESVLDGVPVALPALSLATKVLGRADHGGAAPTVPPPPASPTDEESFGDTLLDLVQRARAEHVDPEQALRTAVRRYAQRVRALEQQRDQSPGGDLPQ